MNKYLKIICFFIIFYSCKYEIKNKENHRVEYSIANNESKLISQLKNSTKKLNINYNEIKIEKFTPIFENSTDKDSFASQSWKVKSTDFIKILYLSIPITESEKNYLYDVKLKSLESILYYKNEQLKVKVNGGGWLYLTNNKNENDYILLGCNLPECEKYFISRGNRQTE